MMTSQYMQQDFCDPWYTHSKKYYLHIQFASVQFSSVQFASIQFASIWFASIRAESPVDKAGHWLIPALLGYIYEHCEFGPTRGSIIVEEDVDKSSSKSGQKRCKGDKVPLGDNRGATRGE